MYVNGKFYTNRNVQSPIVTGYMRTRVSGMPVERKIQADKSFSWMVINPENAKLLFTEHSKDAFQMCVAYAEAYADQIKQMRGLKWADI